MSLRALGAAYFLVGLAAWVLILTIADSDGADATVAVMPWAGLAAASLAVGLLAGRWEALWLAALPLGGAFAVDTLWAVGIIDRSDEREPVPIAFAVLFWWPWLLPALAALITLGVLVRRTSHRLSAARHG